MKIKYNGKNMNIEVKRLSWIEMGIGLMFKFNREKSKNLLFDISSRRFPEVKLTGLFVFFDFMVLWLDEDNNVVEWKIVKPFTFSVKSPKKFKRFIEIPVSKRNKNLIRFIVEGRKI